MIRAPDPRGGGGEQRKRQGPGNGGRRGLPPSCPGPLPASPSPRGLRLGSCFCFSQHQVETSQVPLFPPQPLVAWGGRKFGEPPEPPLPPVLGVSHFLGQGRGLVSTNLLWSCADTETCVSLGSEATLRRASVSPQCPHSVPTCPRARGPGPAHPCSTGSWVTAQEPELTHFPFLGPAQATPPLPGSADERGSPRVPTWVSSSPSLRAQPWVEEEKAQHPLPPPWNVFRPG